VAEAVTHRSVEQTDGGYVCAGDNWTGTSYLAFRLHVAEEEVVQLRSELEVLRAAASGAQVTVGTDPSETDDDDDCPTEEQLEHLRTFQGTPRQFVEAIRAMWWPNDDYIRETPVTRDGTDHVDVAMSTVGWSGNEEIMGVVTATFFHLLWWQTTHRGGHSTYLVPIDQYDATWDLGVLTGPPVPHISTP